ncbi:MAG: helix-turn-helix domain-containing protein [Candidatus Gottesmanbacteria bacterium]|nr:helix-turn-helix domain-containing protein [Candidatus Gottesmanbacteria bacterium]
MGYNQEIIKKAKNYRKLGYSIKEIARLFKISPGTASRWLRETYLDSQALARLNQRRIYGQEMSRNILLAKASIINEQIALKASCSLNKIPSSKELSQLFCSLLYWCEGSKNQNSLKFTNSDPQLIKLFLKFLRAGYTLEEKKFRALMHLHQYHNETKQRLFWQKITGIPKAQFNRSYMKPNTGKNMHKNYPGCLAITYYDSKVAKELTSLYNSFRIKQIGT